MLLAVRPCCREAAALRGARHAKRGGAAAVQPRREKGHNRTIRETREIRLFE